MYSIRFNQFSTKSINFSVDLNTYLSLKEKKFVSDINMGISHSIFCINNLCIISRINIYNRYCCYHSDFFV